MQFCRACSVWCPVDQASIVTHVRKINGAYGDQTQVITIVWMLLHVDVHTFMTRQVLMPALGM